MGWERSEDTADSGGRILPHDHVDATRLGRHQCPRPGRVGVLATGRALKRCPCQSGRIWNDRSDAYHQYAWAFTHSHTHTHERGFSYPPRAVRRPVYSPTKLAYHLPVLALTPVHQAAQYVGPLLEDGLQRLGTAIRFVWPCISNTTRAIAKIQLPRQAYRTNGVSVGEKSDCSFNFLFLISLFIATGVEWSLERALLQFPLNYTHVVQE